MPSALLIFPSMPVVNVIGTLKIPAFSGTAVAAWQYTKKIKLRRRLVSVACTIAFFASFFGSELLLHVRNDFLKPMLVFVLAAVALYTFFKKDLGQAPERQMRRRFRALIVAAIALVIGFYDGFIGPGAGSFLILAFITLLGFDFLQASAHAKMVNLATNLGSVTLFVFRGEIIWLIAIPMALSNAAGGWLGARIALRKGNKFVRLVFLIVVTAILLRLAYDVLK